MLCVKCVKVFEKSGSPWLTGEGARLAAGVCSWTWLIRHFHPLAGFPDQRLHRERVSPGTQTLHLGERSRLSATRISVWSVIVFRTSFRVPAHSGRGRTGSSSSTLGSPSSLTAAPWRCVIDPVPYHVFSETRAFIQNPWLLERLSSSLQYFPFSPLNPFLCLPFPLCLTEGLFHGSPLRVTEREGRAQRALLMGLRYKKHTS